MIFTCHSLIIIVIPSAEVVKGVGANEESPEKNTTIIQGIPRSLLRSTHPALGMTIIFIKKSKTFVY